MPYDPALVQPFRDELTSAGIPELRSAADVDAFFDGAPGTALIIVNSVCGCAAGSARPGARLALAAGLRPDRVGTVFAGQDTEATARARSRFSDVPPSSPSFALFKDGVLVHYVPRHRIEGRSPEEVAGDLKAAFAVHCARPA